jgi:hypothetical protein
MQRHLYILISIAVGAVLLLAFIGGRQRHTDITMAAKSQAVRTSAPDSVQSPVQKQPASAASGRPEVAGNRPWPADDLREAEPASGIDQGPAPLAPELVSLDQILAVVPLTDAAGMNRLYLLARRVDPAVLAGWIGDRLRQTDLAPGARYNAIWIATRTNSPAMLPVWQGLLDRTMPATAGEAKMWRDWMQEHRSENLRQMQAEQLRAVSMIGSLQDTAPAAQEFLFRFAATGPEVPGDVVMLRLEAARAVHQHSRNGLLRLASALSDQDPLRDQLAEIAKIRRGEP